MAKTILSLFVYPEYWGLKDSERPTYLSVPYIQNSDVRVEQENCRYEIGSDWTQQLSIKLRAQLIGSSVAAPPPIITQRNQREILERSKLSAMIYIYSIIIYISFYSLHNQHDPCRPCNLRAKRSLFSLFVENWLNFSSARWNKNEFARWLKCGNQPLVSRLK